MNVLNKMVKGKSGDGSNGGIAKYMKSSFTVHAPGINFVFVEFNLKSNILNGFALGTILQTHPYIISL